MMREYTCGRCGATAETEDTKPKGVPVRPEDWIDLTLSTMPITHKLLCPPCVKLVVELVEDAGDRH